jgi:hypothetical protein
MEKGKKLNFKSIKDVLSRDEMKKIVAGSLGCGVCFPGPGWPLTCGSLVGGGCVCISQPC